MILGPVMPNTGKAGSFVDKVADTIHDKLPDRKNSPGYQQAAGFPTKNSGKGNATIWDKYKNESSTDKPTQQDVSFLTADSSSHHSGSSGKAKKEEFDWLNADLSKHYGMSKETGYAEAMENTSYQRAVKDMKAAGLNPAVLFGANAGDGAGVPNYIRGASSGGGGGSGGGYSGRSYSSGYKWSKSQYGAFSGAGAVIGGLVGAVTSKSARGAAAGATAGAAIGSGIAKILNIF